MHLDPPLVQLFTMLAGAATAESATTDLASRRAMADSTMLLAATGRGEGVEATDHQIDVEGGQITVRILRPAGLVAPAPTFFFIHGGGWFQGNLDTGEVECGPMAAMVPCIVVSVEYRLAPEHRFPVPLLDCAAAYRWMLENAAELGIDADRIAVGGTSAGGNLAAALCLVLRDEGVSTPCLQLLEAPALDLTTMTQESDVPGLDAAGFNEYRDFYLGAEGDGRDPLASPMFAADLSGLPPAVVIVAEHDPLRDQGERYLERLHDAGVPGSGMRILAHVHGTWVIPATSTFVLVAELRAAALRRALAGTLVP